MIIRYKIYNPAGNITALVIGDKYTKEEMKLINNKIMEIETDVEQVGFLSDKEMKITMAGGEFCGNAIRCAIMYYKTEKDSVYIKINNEFIKGGIQDKNIWCSIPVEENLIIKINNRIYKVLLNDITILVVYNKVKKEKLKSEAKKIIKKYNIDDIAVGVMFVDKFDEYIEIHPVVWVKEINTFFLENSCGSGTISVSMVESFLNRNKEKYIIKQPSEEFLETEICFKNKKIKEVILKGKIKTDDEIRKISIL